MDKMLPIPEKCVKMPTGMALDLSITSVGFYRNAVCLHAMCGTTVVIVTLRGESRPYISKTLEKFTGLAQVLNRGSSVAVRPAGQENLYVIRGKTKPNSYDTEPIGMYLLGSRQFKDLLGTQDQLEDETQNPTERKTAMSTQANLAALLRDDTFTVQVTFPADKANKPDSESVRTYTYVGCGDRGKYKPGVKVLVDSVVGMKVAEVVKVDDELQIQPSETTEYKWIILAIDLAPFESLQAENEAIVKTVEEARRQQMQRSFRDGFLASLPAEALLKLPTSMRPTQNVIGGK